MIVSTALQTTISLSLLSTPLTPDPYTPCISTMSYPSFYGVPALSRYHYTPYPLATSHRYLSGVIRIYLSLFTFYLYPLPKPLPSYHSLNLGLSTYLSSFASYLPPVPSRRTVVIYPFLFGRLLLYPFFVVRFSF